MVNRRDFLGAVAVTVDTTQANLFSSSQSNGLSASLALSPKSTYRKIDSSVLGIGLWRPPFSEVTGIIRGWFSGSSCRMWLLPSMDGWKQQTQAVQALKPKKILMFLAVASNYKAHYVSGTENNLPELQHIDSVTKRIAEACADIQKKGISPEAGIFWEAWNEPGYPIGGMWKPDELAHYVSDLSAAVKQRGLPVTVLAPLNQDFDKRSVEWNESYCPALNANTVGGLVTHYYSHHWVTRTTPTDEFLRRAGYGGDMEARVRKDMSYVTRYGHGKWGLHCSEWNIHPPGIKSERFSVSRDMATALFVFDTVKLFIENGIASAQFFHLLIDWVTSHFAVLTHTHAGQNIIHPTGALFGLFHKYLSGNLFKVDIRSPSYLRQADYLLVPDYQVSYVAAMGAISAAGQVSLFISSKHPENIELTLSGDNIPSTVNIVILQGSADSSDAAVIKEAKNALVANKITVPPKSVLALIW